MQFADPRRARAWRAHLDDRFVVLFAGHIDNARDWANAIGLPWPPRPHTNDFARLYAAVYARHGELTDTRLIGEFAVAMVDRLQPRLRLSRSPLRAPPLWYRRFDGGVQVSLAPRAILAVSGPLPLDRAKIADVAWFNYASGLSSWNQGIERIPLGHTGEFNPNGSRIHKYYDAFSLPQVRFPRRQDYVERAAELLREAVTASCTGFNRPGILLSGGLDSSLVAANALEAIDPKQDLPAFTFVPQSDWDGRVPRGTFGDDRPYVEEFAARHPRIRPQYFDNEGRGFDSGMTQLFHLSGIAPINLANYSAFHAPMKAARDAGCDMVLAPNWGNATYSNMGAWGPIEYFLTLRWRQMLLALQAMPDDERPLWRRFAGSVLLPLMPARLWHWQRRLRGIADRRELASPLRPEFVRAMRLVERGRAQASTLGGPQPRSQREWLAQTLVGVEDEANDVWQGFEQLYSVTVRDPAAYRPLAEFCFGLPTGMFLHDGVDRWLARELGKGILPEAQRSNRLYGRHNADWLAKLAPRRAELRDELERLEQVPELAEMFDFPRLKAALDDWPSETPIGEDALPLQIAVTRGLTAARFINYVSGRNC